MSFGTYLVNLLTGPYKVTTCVKISHMCEKFKLQMIRLKIKKRKLLMIFFIFFMRKEIF